MTVVPVIISISRCYPSTPTNSTNSQAAHGMVDGFGSACLACLECRRWLKCLTYNHSFDIDVILWGGIQETIQGLQSILKVHSFLLKKSTFHLLQQLIVVIEWAVQVCFIQRFTCKAINVQNS